jgi:hypothetical protein
MKNNLAGEFFDGMPGREVKRILQDREPSTGSVLVFFVSWRIEVHGRSSRTLKIMNS